MKGEEWVRAGEAGDEVTLPGVDCLLCWIGAMAIGGGELVGDVVSSEEGFEGLGAFVVAFLEDGGESPVLQLVVYGGVGADELGLRSGFDGCGHDGVRISNEGHHDVFVSSAGRDGKTAGLVGGDVAGDLHALHIYQVCSELWNLGRFHIRHHG